MRARRLLLSIVPSLLLLSALAQRRRPGLRHPKAHAELDPFFRDHRRLHKAQRHKRRLTTLRGSTIYSQVRVGIKNVNLGARSLLFPDIIPLLFGNSIQTFKKKRDQYEILYSPKHKTHLTPLKRHGNARRVGGFVFKRSTLKAHPVPMENCVVTTRLVPVSKSLGYFHVWLTCQGVYGTKEMVKQKIYVKSLAQDFADNVQRSLGVQACSNVPTVSGLCNNRGNAVSGVTWQTFRQDVPTKRRPTPDVVSITPSARQVSNMIFNGTQVHPAPNNINVLMVIFGQFIDHEITATKAEKIDVQASAPIHYAATNTTMHFTRAGILRYDFKSCCKNPYRAKRVWDHPPVNTLTSFIDGGAVYGSSNLRANTLRSYRHGHLVLKKRGGELWLPRNNRKDLLFKLANEGAEHGSDLHAAGDVRANENAILLAIHTLFAREHNRVCRALRRWLTRRRARRFLTDDWLYEQAKRVVVAELQAITFNELVPSMLGAGALGKYTGYDASVDARISTEHASFAYRWGHSALPEAVRVRGRDGRVRERKIKELFFKTKLLAEDGLEGLLDGAMRTAAARVDTQVTESLREFLFHPEKRGVLDLVALNLQRSRDLGNPTYMEMQAKLGTGKGLENVREEMRERLKQVYGGEKGIEIFAGGLAEKEVRGGVLGKLFHKVNVEQFRRLRDGDRFYYENMRWHPVLRGMPLMQKVRSGKTRFADLVRANTKVRGRGRGKAFEVGAGW